MAEACRHQEEMEAAAARGETVASEAAKRRATGNKVLSEVRKAQQAGEARPDIEVPPFEMPPSPDQLVALHEVLLRLREVIAVDPALNKPCPVKIYAGLLGLIGLPFTGTVKEGAAVERAYYTLLYKLKDGKMPRECK